MVVDRMSGNPRWITEAEASIDGICQRLGFSKPKPPAPLLAEGGSQHSPHVGSERSSQTPRRADGCWVFVCELLARKSR